MRRDVAFGEEENPLSRGPMWPVAKSGKSEEKWLRFCRDDRSPARALVIGIVDT
jgi:hypothetical protein